MSVDYKGLWRLRGDQTKGRQNLTDLKSKLRTHEHQTEQRTHLNSVVSTSWMLVTLATSLLMG